MSNSLQNLSSQNPFDKLFCNLVSVMFEKAARVANKRVGKNRREKSDTEVVDSDGGYKCIHLDINSFIQKISELIEAEKWKEKDICQLKFLDVGCGVGQKVCLAKMFGFQAYGLELRGELIKEAKKVFNQCDLYDENLIDSDWEDSFIQANALTYPDYDQFDVIYFYCPLYDCDLQAKLELKIARTADVGAIVVPVAGQGIFSNTYYDSIREASKLGWKRRERFYYIRERFVG